MRSRFHHETLNSGIIAKDKRKYSIKEIETMFHVVKVAQEKGITFTVNEDIVKVTFKHPQNDTVSIMTFSFTEASIFFKDIIDTL